MVKSQKRIFYILFFFNFYLKLYIFFSNIRFFYFDINLIYSIDLKNYIVLEVSKCFLFDFKYRVFFLLNKIILTFDFGIFTTFKFIFFELSNKIYHI